MSPFETKGAGDAGCSMHPQPCVRHGIVKNVHTGIHSGSTGNIRHPPRNGFTVSFVLFPGTIGCVDPRRSVRTTPRSPVGLRVIHQDIDADHGAPEPHDFSVRNTAARQARGARSRLSSPCNCLAHTTASRPPHPAPRLVTIGRTPLCIGTGCGDEITNFRKTEAKYFSRKGWTAIREARRRANHLMQDG